LAQKKKSTAALSSSKERSVIGEPISTSLPTRKITEENPTGIFGGRRAETIPWRIGSKARVSIFQSIEFLVSPTGSPDIGLRDSPFVTENRKEAAVISPKTVKQLDGIAHPTPGRLNLFGIPAVLVIAVPFSLRGATAIGATVHSAPPPPGAGLSTRLSSHR
jgi:hypothetical protein